mgnify:CR=1 FL=1
MSNQFIRRSDALAKPILEALGLDPEEWEQRCSGIEIRLLPAEPIQVSLLVVAGDDLIALPWHEFLERDAHGS